MERLTIATVESQATNVPIWALNGSAEVREAADLLITIPKLNGAKVDSLKLPSTWLPICITEQIPRAQLLAASEFRQAVNQGLVILINAKDAESMLDGEGAEEEKERLRETETRVRDALAARGIHADNVSILSGAEIQSTRGAPTEIVANELDPSFVIFFDSLVAKTDVETMNAIRTRGRFRRTEVQHMAAHLIEKPKSLECVRGMLNR